MAEHRPQRHDFVRIDPACEPTYWRLPVGAAMGGVIPGAATHVADWIRRGLPFVARRPLPEETTSTGWIALGLPLPPSLGKARIALSVSRAAIRSISRPPRIEELQHVAPPDWQPTLSAINALGTRWRMDLRIYGSLAWQSVTGTTYLSGQSDLDLLLGLVEGADLQGALEGLVGVANVAPMRIDGEVVRPDGCAVHWRELSSGAPLLLSRSVTYSGLVPRAAFLGSQDAAA